MIQTDVAPPELQADALTRENNASNADLIDISPLERARFFAALGLTVIPLIAGDKKPAVAWGPFHHRQPTDEELISWFDRRRKDRNIGIVAGPVSGIVVVDTDNPEAESWAAEHLPPTSMATQTMRGVHRFYRYPPVEVTNRLGVAVRPNAKLDIIGGGKYVVAPGSVHPSGVIYEAIGSWQSVADLPVFEERWFPDIRDQRQWTTDRKIGSGKAAAGPVALVSRVLQDHDPVYRYLLPAHTLSSRISETDSDLDLLPPCYRGSRARWRKELDRFCRLWLLRGAFHEGSRANAVMVFSYLLARNRRPADEIVAAATFLGRQCAPSLPELEIAHKIDCGVRRLTRNLTRPAIDNWLCVSPEERAYLDTEEQERAERVGRRQDRYEAIERALLRRSGRPLRGIAADLRAQGFTVSPSTLWRHGEVLRRISETVPGEGSMNGDLGLRDAA